MGNNAIKSLHKNIQEQFSIMRQLMEEIKFIKENGGDDLALRLADILDKLSDKAHNMNKIIRNNA